MSPETLPLCAGEWQGDGPRVEDNNGGGNYLHLVQCVSSLGWACTFRQHAKMDEVFDDVYREKYFTNIPSEDYRVHGLNRVKGGPDLPPNATKHEKAVCKAFADKTRRLNYAKMKEANTKTSPHKLVTNIDCDLYSGDQCAHIRLMEIIERELQDKYCKELHHMRNKMAGDNFYVSASNTAQGWQICELCCRDHHNNLIIPTTHLFIPVEKKRCPFESAWIGHLLKGHLETSPGLSYALLREYLIHHVRLDLVTENILQNAHVWATNELFGNPDHNVGYAEGV
jgi:hypothetical protein